MTSETTQKQMTYDESQDLFDLLDAYQKKFKDGFPTFEFGNNEEFIKPVLIQCLESGKPYVSDLPDDVLV